MARRSRASKTKRSIDFSQEVKNFEPDMEYEVEVKSASWEDGDKAPYIALVFKGTDDDNEDAELYHNASISPKALHRTRLVLEALGYEIEDGASIDIDTEELVGMRCMIHTYEDEYRGNDGEKRRSVRADDFWPVDGKKGGKKSSKKEDEDDEDDKKSSKRGRGKKDEEEVEKISKSDVEDMSRKQLIKLIDEHELDVDPDSRKLKKDDEALAEAVIEALEEKDLLEEEKKAGKRGGKKDEEDEDEDKESRRSSRGSKGSKGRSKTWSEDDIDDMSEDDLSEVVEQAGLDIDLDDFRTLRKKKNALKDALEEVGMMDG